MAIMRLQALNGAPLGATPPTPHGRWLTGAFVELLDDGRNVRLWDVLQFEDRYGVVHTAPVDFVSDGSSHPQFTWSVVGGPLSGKYRRPAIMYDYWLWLARTHPEQMTEMEAHALFRDALRAEGLSDDATEVFFTAVVGKTWWNQLQPMVTFLAGTARLIRRVGWGRLIRRWA